MSYQRTNSYSSDYSDNSSTISNTNNISNPSNFGNYYVNNPSVNKSSILSSDDDYYNNKNQSYFPSGTGLENFSKRSKYATIGRPLKPYGGKMKTKKRGTKRKIRSKRKTRKYRKNKK